VVGMVYRDTTIANMFGCDSIVSLELKVWLAECDTAYFAYEDSINDGETYTFGTQELKESGIYVDTLLKADLSCDSIVTLTLIVKQPLGPVIEPYSIALQCVYGDIFDTLCPGTSYSYGEKSIVVDADMQLTDTIYEIRRDSDHVALVVTLTDSVTRYNLTVWHDKLQLPEGANWGHAFCGTEYMADTIVGYVREAIAADALFPQDAAIELFYQDSKTGAYVPYDGSEMAVGAGDVKLRLTVSTDCGSLTYDKTLAIEMPDYELSTMFDNMPAVSKYNDWLLLVDLDSLNNVYGLYPEADSVKWYRMTGTQPNIDNDELVGTGYYYTDDRHLVGHYYAIIGMQIQTDECGGEWRTRIVVQANNSTPLAIAPNIVRVGTPVYLYHLPIDEVSTLQIYTADGQCIQTITHQPTADNANGIATIATRNLLSGVYTVRITNSGQQTALRFIITQ